MRKEKFRGLMLRKDEGRLKAEVETIDQSALPQAEVLIQVDYSSLNYKDAMAVGDRGIIRNFPAIPGIDLAGRVAESSSPAWKEGDGVILTGWGVGERWWGGLAEYARAKPEWLLPLPAGLSSRQAMAAGTAGLTAMLCLLALEKAGALDREGEVLVTGASGGVGSFAVALLAARGTKVVAMSGKPEEEARLRSLGAARVVGREEYAKPSKPGRFSYEAEAFAAAIDCVGGSTLASIISRLGYGGAVAACGLAGGTDLDTHVFPFILRGVSLLGVDSVRCPNDRRREAWERLAAFLAKDLAGDTVRELGLAEVPAECARMLKGGGRGRVVVDPRR